MTVSEPEEPAIALALDLVGDGDELDLIVAIEESFDVRWDGRAETCRTLGDVAAWLETEFAARPAGEKCASAMAFHRLGRAIGGGPFSPGSRLSRVLVGERHRAWNELAAKVGLRLPQLQFAGLGTLGTWSLLAAIVALPGLVVGLPLVVPPALAAAGIVLIRLDEGRYPVETLGELAIAVAKSNHARMVRDGARSDGGLIWRSLTYLVARHVGVPSGRAIGPETRLIGGGARR